MTNKVKLALTVSALAISGMNSIASAQIVTDEIIVTAQKKEQLVQDVAVSVTAYSGEQIEALGIDNTTEITEQIPSLQVSAWSPNVTIFNIRGVSQNSFSDNLEAPVAVYLDDVYMGSINGLSGQLFDVERVEVLRGPQGTLFGRNATGGLIHYVTRDASDEDANGYVKGTYGSFNRVGIEGAMGGAVSDNVRVRLAAQYSKADGYIKAKAALPGVFDAGSQDLGGENGFAIRGTVQAEITDNLTGNFTFKHSRDDGVDTGGYVFDNCSPEANGYCSVNAAGIGDGTGGVVNGITFESASPFDNFSESSGRLDREVNSYTGDFDYKFENGMTLTSISNYTSLEKEYLEDGDALPVLVINFGTKVDYKQFSQELRLAGSTERADWQIGTYYLNAKTDGQNSTFGAPIVGTAFDVNGGSDNPSVVQDYLIKSENYSIFGQVDFSLTDRLNLTAGLRYSIDDKTNDYEATLINGSFGNTVVGSDEIFSATIPDSGKIDYKDWAGKLSLDYELNDDTLVFASINRGIKGGNWTLASDIVAANFQHDEEVLHSYEVGFKTALADRTLKINGTAFIYDYDGYQAFSLNGGGPQISNSDAKSHGAELEIYWSPTPSFDVILGGAYLNTKVDEVQGPGFQIGPDFTGGAGPAVVGACVLDAANGIYICDHPQDTIEGAEFPNAPKLSLNYLFRYNVDALGANLAAQIDGAWYDDQFLEVTNGPAAVQEAYGVTNLSVSAETTGGVVASLFVKNAFDQEYRAYALNNGILGTTSYFAPPRTYGVSLKYSFD